MTPLADKTALVTGASRGIGQAAALRLARDGATVGVHYANDADGAASTLAQIEAAGGSGFLLQADLSTLGAPERLLRAFDEHADHLDILINNAGTIVNGHVDEIKEESFEELFALNVRAPIFLAQQALTRMGTGGRIINLSSATAYIAVPSSVMYGASKGAVSTLTRTLAWGLGDRGITVNAVSPGFTNTTMNDWLGDEESRAWSRSQSALGRIAEVEDIADVIGFLASDDARWVNGQVIDVSGGSVLGLSRPAA